MQHALCMGTRKLNSFKFGDKFFYQKDGVSIGFPLIDNLEQKKLLLIHFQNKQFVDIQRLLTFSKLFELFDPSHHSRCTLHNNNDVSLTLSKKQVKLNNNTIGFNKNN